MEEIIYKFPVLETNRTNLVEITAAHKKDQFNLFTDDRVTAFFPVITLKQEDDILSVVAHFKQNFEKNISIRWGIKLRVLGQGPDDRIPC